MRQISDRLRQLLEMLGSQLVEHQCEQDGQGEVDEQPQDIDAKRIAQHIPEVDIVHELLEIVQSDPFCRKDAPNSGDDVIFLEGNQYTVERNKCKDENEYNTGKNHGLKRQLILVPEVPACARGFARRERSL